ncbi:MAG: hypothetical protein QNJ29_07940 [Rhizobiaceae bacterium]|nr:hypothetical protein [Rhizobiaceae bacterium]
MMAETVFVMTVLGCGNQTDACDFVAEPEATYVSQLDCEAAVEKTLLDYQHAAYPVLVGDCAERPGTVQVVKVEPRPAEPNRFEQLRADADAFEPFGRVRVLLSDISDGSESTFKKLGSLLRQD